VPVLKKSRPEEPVAEPWCRKIVEVKRREISYLKFILEGYDGLVTVTTVDGNSGRVSLTFHPSVLPDVERILETLKQEIVLTEINLPP